MRLQFAEQHVLFRDERYYCAFPSLASCVDGNIILAFRIAPDEGSLCSAALGQQRPGRHIHPRSQIAIAGVTESSLKVSAHRLLPPDLAAADQDPSLHVLKSGRLLLSSFSWYPLTSALGEELAKQRMPVGHDVGSGTWAWPWGAHVSVSDDCGKSWRPRVYLPPVPTRKSSDKFTGGHSICRTRGQLVELDDGTCLLGCYAESGEGAPFESYVYASNDGGVSWAFRSRLSAPLNGVVGLVEPSLAIKGDGGVVAYHRSIKGEDRLVLARSTDNGFTWSAPVPSEIVGHPFSVLQLRNGSALLIYARRRRPFSICMSLLNSEGMPAPKTEIALPIDVTTRDFGYPSAVELSDGSVLIAYYSCDDGGVRYIGAYRIVLHET